MPLVSSDRRSRASSPSDGNSKASGRAGPIGSSRSRIRSPSPLRHSVPPSNPRRLHHRGEAADACIREPELLRLPALEPHGPAGRLAGGLQAGIRLVRLRRELLELPLAEPRDGRLPGACPTKFGPEKLPLTFTDGRNGTPPYPIFAASSFTALMSATRIGCMSKTSTSSVSSSSPGSFIFVVETHSGNTSRTFSASNP